MKLGSVVLLLLAAPLLASGGLVYQPTDCSAFKGLSSGVYTIYPAGDRSAVEVFCDMDTDGGRWTVFHRRMDGSVNFYRPWKQYKVGFGPCTGEYWLGLDNLHYLTSSQKYELRVDMEDFDGKKAFARYSSFSVGNECSGYVLKVSGYTKGGIGDSMTYHNGMKFTTLDKDQDTHKKNCARLFLGAFWYKNCHSTNPNGVYRWGADGTLYAVGMSWATWKGNAYSLKKFSMKIRPVE